MTKNLLKLKESVYYSNYAAFIRSLAFMPVGTDTAPQIRDSKRNFNLLHSLINQDAIVTQNYENFTESIMSLIRLLNLPTTEDRLVDHLKGYSQINQGQKLLIALRVRGKDIFLITAFAPSGDIDSALSRVNDQTAFSVNTTVLSAPMFNLSKNRPYSTLVDLDTKYRSLDFRFHKFSKNS